MKKTTNRFSTLLLTVVMALTLIPTFPMTAYVAQTSTFNLATGTGTGSGWSWNGTVLTVNNGADIEITGTVSNGRYVKVADNAAANITLNGLSITVPSGGQPPFSLNSGANVNLTLVGENIINAWLTGWAGIQVSNTATLTISEASTGQLTVTGGNTMSAGIGGYNNGSGGNITINGGTITVTSTTAAGIGGGYGSASGTITINGGNVTATGGVGSACIGGGRNGSGGSNITINGGTITAIGGGTYGAGIGNGEYGKGGSFTMNGNAVVFTNSINVNATYTKGIHFPGNNGVMYGNVTLNQNVTFDSNKSLFIGNNTLTITSGYTLTNNGTIATDGGTIVHGGGYGTYIGNSPMRAVTLYAIPGIPAPSVGAVPVTSINTEQYSGTIQWSPSHGVFQEWTTYIANIMLTAKSNYTFAVVPANAFTVSGATHTSNSLGSSTITAKFSIGNADNNKFDVSNGTISIDRGAASDTLKVIQGGVIVKDNIPQDDQIIICGSFRNTSSYATGSYVKVFSGVTANIKLSNVNIDSAGYYMYAFNMAGATVFLELEGKNILKSGSNRSSLLVPVGASLTISGSGSLNATGGGGSPGAPGIGNDNGAGGDIIIDDGTITAVGNGYAAGIGGGGHSGGVGGKITINGGIVTATGCYGAGIGSGYQGTGCEVFINGGIVTATGESGIGGAGSTVTITDGIVTAKGGGINAAGIGGGGNGTDVTITITGGTVTATGSGLCAGIGGAQNGSGGNITINGGIVTAIGGKHGIGSGNNGAVGTFTMNGNAIVFASSISDVSPKDNGILFIGNIGIVYGDVIIEDGVEIPNDYTLTVQNSTTLTIPEGVEFTNDGTIENRCNIIVAGRLINNGVINNYNTINGTGEQLGNPPIHIIVMDNDTPPDSGNGWTYTDGVYTILDDAIVTITGNNQLPYPSKRRIVVAISATAKITLVDATIVDALIEGQGNDPSPLFLSNNSEVNLILVGDNVLTASDSWAGIHTTNAVLTIDGTGNLTAAGGIDAAGIGGSSWCDGGTVIINSGTVTANGGWAGSGIGGGNMRSGGEIIINSGTVIANGGFCGAGIGGGENGNGGEVTIKSGTVTAIGGNYGAGVGGGFGGAGNTITINGGTISANGGGNNLFGYGAGIGGGSGGDGGDITINGGIVAANSSARGAGIGNGWYSDDGDANIGSGWGGNGGTLTMNGSGVVFASSVKADTEGVIRGLLFDGTIGAVYGIFELDNDLEIPINCELTVLNGASLTIPEGITLTNRGTVIPADGSTVTVNGTVLENLINGSNVTSLMENSKTYNSVLLNASELLAVTRQDVEYAYNTSNNEPLMGWQDTQVFTGLMPNTTYYFFARSKENTNLLAGAASSLPIKTLAIGDINGDGCIDILDVIITAEIAVGYKNYTPEQIARANVSDKYDLTVDITDVVLIAERAVGGTEPFPVELL